MTLGCHEISKAKYNTAEFFAEAFANSQLGRPNAFGKAMSDYLRDHRLN